MGLRRQAASRRVTTHESTRNRIAVRRRSDRTHGATTLRRAEICRAIGGGSPTPRTAGARTPRPEARRLHRGPRCPRRTARGGGAAARHPVRSGRPHRPDPPRLPPRSADLALLPHLRGSVPPQPPGARGQRASTYVRGVARRRTEAGAPRYRPIDDVPSVRRGTYGVLRAVNATSTPVGCTLPPSKHAHMSSTLRAARRTVGQPNERGGFCGMSAVPPPVLGFATRSGLRAVADIAYWCVTRGK